MLQTNPEARKAIGPFLKNPALRRVIQTFTNDPEGDIARWATNPEVQRGSRDPGRNCGDQQEDLLTDTMSFLCCCPHVCGGLSGQAGQGHGQGQGHDQGHGHGHGQVRFGIGFRVGARLRLRLALRLSLGPRCRVRCRLGLKSRQSMRRLQPDSFVQQDPCV